MAAANDPINNNTILLLDIACQWTFNFKFVDHNKIHLKCYSVNIDETTVYDISGMISLPPCASN